MNLEGLESRLAVLEDIEAIKQLHFKYVNSLVNTDWEALVDCFAPNGMVDINAGTAAGQEQIYDLFAKEISKIHIGVEGLFVTHPIISVTGDSAQGKWLLFMMFAQPRKFDPKPHIFTTDDAPDWTCGYYDVTYVRHNSVWKIRTLRYRIRMASPMTNLTPQ